MRILFFTKSLRSGGRERRMVELIKGLLREFEDVEIEVVITVKEIHYQEILDLGVKIHIIERKYLKKDPRLFYLFYKIAHRFKPDIIHVWEGMVAFYAIPTKILLHVPMLNNQITDAPSFIPNKWFNYKLSFLFSDLIVANSYAGLKAYNVMDNRSKVIYNGFDFKRLNNLKKQSVIKDKLGIVTPYVVGMIASFSKLKDYVTYIKAANIILNQREDITFLCAGAGNKVPFIKMAKFKKKTIFLDQQKDVECIMNICDIGVLTTFSEGISNSLLEFMALSKPVIATGEGGISELVENNRNGFIFPSGNVEELTKSILYLLDNASIRIEMGKQGRAIVENKFNINKMISSFSNLYQDLCAE